MNVGWVGPSAVWVHNPSSASFLDTVFTAKRPGSNITGQQAGRLGGQRDERQENTE